MEKGQQSVDNINDKEPSHSKNEQSQSQTRESSDEGEEDIQFDSNNNNIIDSTLLHWIKVNKLTFIKQILLQQEISLTEIASLSHNQRRYITHYDRHLCFHHYHHHTIYISKS